LFENKLSFHAIGMPIGQSRLSARLLLMKMLMRNWFVSWRKRSCACVTYWRQKELKLKKVC